MPNVKNKGTRLTPITFQKRSRCDPSECFASYHLPLAPSYSHAMSCNSHFSLKRCTQKMVYNIRKMVSNIHMYNILSKTI